MRGAIANGRGHEKLFFTEPIPNEVQRWFFVLTFITTLLTTSPVLSTIMDTTTPTPKHGIRAPLVSTLSLCLTVCPCLVHFLTGVESGTIFASCLTRHMANFLSMFKQSHAYVSLFPTLLHHSDMKLKGCEPADDFLLGP